MHLSDKSISITKIEDMREICGPLFKYTPISYVHYSRAYKDGSLCCFVTDPNWHKHFWKKNFHLHSDHFWRQGLCLTTALPGYSKEVADARNYFNIYHKFEITEEDKDYFECFGFASTANNDRIG